MGLPIEEGRCHGREHFPSCQSTGWLGTRPGLGGRGASPSPSPGEAIAALHLWRLALTRLVIYLGAAFVNRWPDLAGRVQTRPVHPARPVRPRRGVWLALMIGAEVLDQRTRRRAGRSGSGSPWVPGSGTFGCRGLPGAQSPQVPTHERHLCRRGPWGAGPCVCRPLARCAGARGPAGALLGTGRSWGTDGNCALRWAGASPRRSGAIAGHS